LKGIWEVCRSPSFGSGCGRARQFEVDENWSKQRLREAVNDRIGIQLAVDPLQKQIDDTVLQVGGEAYVPDAPFMPSAKLHL